MIAIDSVTIGDTFEVSLSAILLGRSIAIAIGDTFSAVSLSIIAILLEIIAILLESIVNIMEEICGRICTKNA